MADGLGKLILLAGVALIAYGAYSGFSAVESSTEGGGADAGSDGADGGDAGSVVNASTASGSMTPQQIADLAQSTLSAMGVTDITPQMAATIAMIESGGDPAAERQEPRLNDASYGLMQTLLGTATWLYGLGYSSMGEPTSETLLNAEGSMYFGCGYLHWLRNYQGSPQTDDFVVAAYNGGPGGASGAGPQAYLASYQSTYSSLWSV